MYLDERAGNLKIPFQNNNSCFAPSKHKTMPFLQRTLLFLFLIVSVALQAQTETDLLRLEYSGEEAIITHDYAYINSLQSNINRYALTLNFGHPLDSNNWNLFYQAKYRHFNQRLDKTQVNQDSNWQALPSSYYQLPASDQLYLAIGTQKRFKNNHRWISLFYLSFTDDFFGDQLKSNLNWGAISYMEFRRPSGFTYGLGLGTFQFEQKQAFFPAISLQYEAPQWGFEVLVPNAIRCWKNLSKNAYLEANIHSNFYSLTFQNPEGISSVDISGGQGTLSYNYIWNQFVKVSLGVYTPFYSFDLGLDDDINIVNYQLQDGVGFQVGIGLVVE